jgi:hypothetical protein
VHPASILDGELMEWLKLWLACRGGPMMPGKLPYGGGVAEQPARLMAVFDLMDRTAGDLQPAKAES